MNKNKTDYFYMRMNTGQKEEIRSLSNDLNMSMSQYVWYLVTKDKENRDDK